MMIKSANILGGKIWFSTIHLVHMLHALESAPTPGDPMNDGRLPCPQQPCPAPRESCLRPLLCSQCVPYLVFLFSCCLLVFSALLSFAKNSHTLYPHTLYPTSHTPYSTDKEPLYLTPKESWVISGKIHDIINRRKYGLILILF